MWYVHIMEYFLAMLHWINPKNIMLGKKPDLRSHILSLHFFFRFYVFIFKEGEIEREGEKH